MRQVLAKVNLEVRAVVLDQEYHRPQISLPVLEHLDKALRAEVDPWHLPIVAQVVELVELEFNDSLEVRLIPAEQDIHGLITGSLMLQAADTDTVLAVDAQRQVAADQADHNLLTQLHIAE